MAVCCAVVVSCCAVLCRSATKSYITSLCLEKFLDNTSDLVFVEFIANDGSEMDLSYTDNQKARFFERFLRKILSKPSAPAVVMMQVSSRVLCVACIPRGTLLGLGPHLDLV